MPNSLFRHTLSVIRRKVGGYCRKTNKVSAQECVTRRHRILGELLRL